MKKDVIIKFHGLNSIDDSDVDKTEFMTTGSFFEKNSKYYLQYDEITEEEPEKTSTTLKIDGNKVTVLRYGKNNNTQLIVEKGKKHLCLYDTPYGAISIGIVAKDVFVDIGEHEGKIKLHYGVEYNNVLTGRNKLDLSFEEVAQSE
ncbi:MAG: DUF1934 domain-containing protein [Clostridia bacterium]|nr:DUF1934 domain-containing protein [Clostridia bacterium]